MATYKIKAAHEADVKAGAVVHFTSPIEGIGYKLNLATATQEQLEKMYLLQHSFVEKVEKVEHEKEKGK